MISRLYNRQRHPEPVSGSVLYRKLADLAADIGNRILHLVCNLRKVRAAFVNLAGTVAHLFHADLHARGNVLQVRHFTGNLLAHLAHVGELLLHGKVDICGAFGRNLQQVDGAVGNGQRLQGTAIKEILLANGGQPREIL